MPLNASWCSGADLLPIRWGPGWFTGLCAWGPWPVLWVLMFGVRHEPSGVSLGRDKPPSQLPFFVTRPDGDARVPGARSALASSSPGLPWLAREISDAGLSQHERDH